MPDHKKALFNLCLNYVNERMREAQLAINEAQNASNNDTKSSAGDKYETSREMLKQDSDRNMAQLNEANKLRVALQLIPVETHDAAAVLGSVVYTDNGNFYLAISAGKLEIDGYIYMAISPASPLGIKLKGLQSGQLFTLNGKSYTVLNII